MNRVRILVAILAILIAVGAVTLGLGAARWRRANDTALDALRSLAPRPALAWDLERDTTGLPSPVQRYFRFALGGRPQRVTRARLAQVGTILMSERGGKWAPFTASEEFVTARRGFVWLARVRMAPGLGVHVRDSYLDGVGRMRAAVLEAFPVVDMGDRPEMASGALSRYLAEAVWFPTALLPSEGVRWTAIDDSTARASLTDKGVTVEMEFRFARSGEIVSSRTHARAHESRGAFEYLPWGGVYLDYREHSGMRIPDRAEVAWWIDGRRVPYWRGRVTTASFELAAD